LQICKVKSQKEKQSLINNASTSNHITSFIGTGGKPGTGETVAVIGGKRIPEFSGQPDCEGYCERGNRWVANEWIVGFTIKKML
jgi:hypothetical protein